MQRRAAAGPETVVLGVAALRPQDVEAIARGHAHVTVAPVARERIARGHAALVAIAARGEAIYGVSTGLGAAADMRVTPDGGDRQRRIGLARSVGVGPLAATDTVRAVMAARLAGLAAGRSGASPGVVDTVGAMLNAGVHPCMPLIGSVGEADLAPLAHIATVVMGGGEAEYRGEVMRGGEALTRAGLAWPEPGIKDGLALVSSNAGSAGPGALAVQDCAQVLDAGYGAAALSSAGFGANMAPLDPRAAALRPAPGQAAAAQRLAGLLGGTQRMGRRLQDPLSLRCLAPVLGAADHALAAAAGAVAIELGGAGDNPAILEEDAAVLPNANFDATYLALGFEGLGLALARVAALAGARIMQLMTPEMSGLPRFLSPVQDGRNGFATLQKTAAALVAGIQHLANPMPTVILPVAGGVEDYATMAPATVAKTAAAVDQVRLLVAIELLVAAQACDLRGAQLGPGVASIHAVVRQAVPRLDEDRASSPDVAVLDGLIRSGRFTTAGLALYTA